MLKIKEDSFYYLLFILQDGNPEYNMILSPSQFESLIQAKLFFFFLRKLQMVSCEAFLCASLPSEKLDHWEKNENKRGLLEETREKS